MKQLLSKTSQLTVFIIIFGALFPVLALAATGFQNVTYKNGTVTGSVYSDIYEPSISQVVYMYDPSDNYLGAATTTGATYSVSEGVYSYDFSAIVSNGYSYLNLLEKVTDSVYQTVYNTTPNNGSGSGSSSGDGGGGGFYNGPSITVSSDGKVDAYTLANALRANDTVELSLSGDYALIPANALVDFISGNKVLRVKNVNGTYIIPLSVFKLNDLAQALDSEISDMTIKVSISAVTGAAADDIQAAASALGGSAAGMPADFNVIALSKEDRTQAVDFGSTYVSRILPLAKAIDPGKATGVLYDAATKKLTFVPTVFTAADGNTEAVLKRNGSSVYTVIELDKSFNDIAGHWAKSYVELLANKLVVDGVTDTMFEPERNITRAEFAALVVRSLGLGQGSYSGTFKDVLADDWFAGVVGAAVDAKIIDGYEDGTFRPDASITREELAAMVVRAMKYAGLKHELTADQQSAMLAKFKDSGTIVWAQTEMATAIYTGIVDGMTDDTIGSYMNATRAQSAAMLKRFLSNAEFIN